jgi:alpha-beta hydrolase superfamily lysophospholipase
MDVVALDFRGHGRSPGRRGVVRRYEDLVGDLQAVVARGRGLHPDLPLFVLGHSNGGQVVLRFTLLDLEGVDGVITSNPPIRIAMPVPPAKLKLGRFLHALAPWMTLRAETLPTCMTRDPAMQAMYDNDRLRHDRISAPLFFGMVEGGQMLMARAGEIRTPILMLVGGSDPVICPSSNREFYERLGSEDKTLFLYPRMLHEPFNELGREQVFEDLIRWLDARLT